MLVSLLFKLFTTFLKSITSYRPVQACATLIRAQGIQPELHITAHHFWELLLEELETLWEVPVFPRDRLAWAEGAAGRCQADACWPGGAAVLQRKGGGLGSCRAALRGRGTERT